MRVATYRYGEVQTDFALRIGVSRRMSRMRPAPFDLWLRALAPSEKLEGRFRKKLISFSEFAAAYRGEMRRTEPRQLIELLAFLAEEQAVSLGCSCEDEAICHRSILQSLIKVVPPLKRRWNPRHESASPVCFMEEEP